MLAATDEARLLTLLTRGIGLGLELLKALHQSGVALLRLVELPLGRLDRLLHLFEL